MSERVEKPYVLTKEVQAMIVRSLAEGNYLTVACTRAGTTSRSFNRWRKRWEEGDEVAQQFTDFFLACQKAMAEAEATALATIRRGDPGWQGSAWYLERKFPKRWGRDRSSSPPPPEPLSEMTDEELDLYAEQVARKCRR
jgi:hypothetical protein